MIQHVQKPTFRRLLGIAFLCALGLTLLIPAVASAHAILLSSNPAKDAHLRTPPGQVQMVFSEDLNPALSTAQVINAERQRVDNNDAHVNADNSKEMDLTLHANLPPDVYIVVWRSDSADDGHVLLGSFIFTVLNADGSVPQLAPGSNPAQGILGNINAGAPGTLDGPAFFNLVAVTLVELAAIFWAGAQLWVNFVLQSSAEKHPTEQNLNTQVERRFERRFSLPTLGLLLIANLGVLYGQVLTLTGNNWGAALNFQLLREQATSGRFGTYWMVRIGVILLAFLIGLFMILSRRRPRVINQALPLVNLFLASVLFIAITMSGHAAAVSAIIVPYSVVVDWLHLLASALWVGGMVYILLIYLPVLKARPLHERTRSLLAILPQFTPLAIAGVAIMAITGPLNATFHLTSLDQFITTAYGRALVVKVLLIGALLATSAYHVGWLRPRMKREYQKYTYAKERLEKLQAQENKENSSAEREAATEENRQRNDKLLAQQVKLREGRLAKRTGQMTRVLSWEPWLGVAVIVCVGLMNVFAGTLTPATAAQPSPQQTASGTPAAGAFNGTAKTTDGKYSVTLNITPNRFGTNVFTVQVTDIQTGKRLGANEAGVTAYLTMLDMDMGTDSTDLQPNGKGGFSGSGDLTMGGNWAIKIQVRTLDNTLHEANFKIYTPF
jgi:copper transport protein